jgi:flagellar assembly protein FliH
MSSSEAPALAPYAFEQLEAPPEVALRDLEAPIAAAQAEAERIRAEAREVGRAEGLAEGRAQVSAALASLAAAVDGIAALRDEAAEALERDAVELSLQLSEKVVAGTIAVEPERVADIVRGALRRLAERRRVTVLVHPEDLDAVRAVSDGFAAELGGIEHCDVQAERRIGRGGAIVRTEEGQVDACVETQLARARELVEAELGA